MGLLERPLNYSALTLTKQLPGSGRAGSLRIGRSPVYPQSNLGHIPLWVERQWDKEALLRRRQEVGSRQFERGYRQKAYTDAERTFPSFMKCKKPMKILDLFVPKVWLCYSGVDLASESRPGTVIVTLARSPEGIKMPVDIRRGSWGGADTVAQMFDVASKWMPVTMYVENNALQDYVRQWALEKARDFPVQGYHTGKQKADPIEGLAGIEVEMENSSWIIPGKEYEGHLLNCECPWCIWEREMTNYPQSETTDCVMATWFAREAARSAGEPGLFFAGG